ncbi:MAG: 30S ribosome-binding factor RbfA [Spirochaetales bacterium]
MDRLVRASQLIGEIVSNAIVQGHVKDPRVSSLCSVVDVEVSKDLRYATVRISGYMEAESLKSAVKGLNAAAGFLQSRIASQVHWKATPKLRFVVDTTIRQAQSVIDTLDAMDVSPEEDRGT